MKKVFWFILVCTAMAVFFYAVLSATDRFVYARLDALGVLPRDPGVTELYFADHEYLPHAASAYEPLEFSFVIHNGTHDKTRYPYVVRLVTSEMTTVLDLGERSVLPQGFSTTTIAFTPKTNIAGRVEVELLEQRQSIHFLLSNE